MDHYWRLLVAIFFVSVGTMLLLFAYVFQGSVIATISIWASFALILIGLCKGFLAIIERHSEQKEKDNA